VHEVDKAKVVRGWAGLRRFGKNCAALNFDLWISPHKSLRSAYVALAAKAPVRIGYNSPWYNRCAYTHTVPRRFSELHEIERILELLKPLGVEPSATAWPVPNLPDAARQAAADFWETLPPAPVLGIHPGSVWPTKRWPAEYFAEIAVRALRLKHTVLIFAGPGEEDTAESVMLEVASILGDNAEMIPSGVKIINLAGQLSLAELVAYFQRLSCLVCNDSGPMHLAWIQDVPVTAVFGPTARSLGFFPRGENSRVVELDLPCRPCGLHGHRVCPQGHHQCMTQITPDQVWEQVKSTL
jgi:heptosyltransferase-2